MLIPALDLIDAQVVRLYQGDYQQQQQYPVTPLQQALAYQQAGAELLHLVDLTGAKQPQQRQTALLQQISNSLTIPVQAGGGIRSHSDIDALLNAGLSRVVIGSVAIKQPDLTKEFFHSFGAEQLVLALDVNIDASGQRLLATHGWQQSSGRRIEAVLDDYLALGLKHVLCTDISKDGTLSGPNIALYTDLKQQFPNIIWQASGGISCLADFSQLKSSKVDSVIIGKALLENKFTLEEALACWQNA